MWGAPRRNAWITTLDLSRRQPRCRHSAMPWNEPGSGATIGRTRARRRAQIRKAGTEGPRRRILRAIESLCLKPHPLVHMSLSVVMSSERKISVTMALVFLPWMAAVLYTAGGWASLNFIAYAIVVFAAGYSILSAALPAPARTQTLVFAPAVGIVAISALTALWVRVGLPLIWAPAWPLQRVLRSTWFLWRKPERRQISIFKHN